MLDESLSREIERIRGAFPGADENKLAALEGMIEQAAYERLYLKRLNEQALASGLVKINPNNPMMQRSLPLSAEIARHAAALTNILDKLCKHLGAPGEEDDNDLDEFE